MLGLLQRRHELAFLRPRRCELSFALHQRGPRPERFFLSGEHGRVVGVVVGGVVAGGGFEGDAASVLFDRGSGVGVDVLAVADADG